MVDFIQYLIIACINGVGFAIIAKNLKLIRDNRFILNSIVLSIVVLITIVFNTVRAPLMIIVILIMSLIQMRESKKLLVIKTLMAITVIILSDALLGLVYMYGLNMSFGDVVNSPYVNELMIFSGVITSLFGYIMSKYTIKSLEFIRDKIIGEYRHSKKVVLLLIVNITTFILFIIITNFIISFEQYNYDALIELYTVFNIIYLIISLVVSIVIIIVFNEKIKVVEKESELNNLVEYNSTLETLYSDIRNFKHDYVNILSTLSGFMEEKDYNGLEEYFNNNLVAYTEKMNTNNYKIGVLRNLKINSIKGLIFSKYIKSQEKNINLEIEILEDIEKINIEEIDFARCLGIIIDNAIEAAVDSLDKNVTIAFINSYNGVIVVVKNTITENVPPLYKLMEEGFSTKGEKRGIGLSNFNQILSKYPNVNKDINIENNEFIVTIECKE